MPRTEVGERLFANAEPKYHANAAAVDALPREGGWPEGGRNGSAATTSHPPARFENSIVKVAKGPFRLTRRFYNETFDERTARKIGKAEMKVDERRKWADRRAQGRAVTEKSNHPHSTHSPVYSKSANLPATYAPSHPAWTPRDRRRVRKAEQKVEYVKQSRAREKKEREEFREELRKEVAELRAQGKSSKYGKANDGGGPGFP